ncbi:hypothetical protein [Natronorubrum sp. DTA7]|uniref:hypothetical protein n=1 Tax=Natronorubrum sp. DTA7 TaxID=3447016 RepID=UPI003F862B7E
MTSSDEHADDMRWGWTCPRCNADVPVHRDDDSETFRWECPVDDCPSVGFGFKSRRRARIALREYREAYRNIYR